MAAQNNQVITCAKVVYINQKLDLIKK